MLLLDDRRSGLRKDDEFVFEMVVRLRDEGLTVLLVEQKAGRLLRCWPGLPHGERRMLASGVARNFLKTKSFRKHSWAGAARVEGAVACGSPAS